MSLTSSKVGPGWCVYTLQKGAILWHGTKSTVTASDVLARGNWFGDEELAESFAYESACYEKNTSGGKIHQFEVTETMQFLALDPSEKTITSSRHYPGSTHFVTRPLGMSGRQRPFRG